MVVDSVFYIYMFLDIMLYFRYDLGQNIVFGYVDWIRDCFECVLFYLYILESIYLFKNFILFFIRKYI